MPSLKTYQISNLVRRCKVKLGYNGQLLPNGQSAKSGLNKSLPKNCGYAPPLLRG
ncbi:hypothetical protein [Okeania sp. SIO2C9]|uniref:hypothetical protein n=1 Tax=Okeania sp. SIO2C9 TaxID=2607791 RepID=UPI0025FAAE38|nr:hypothetical protein [Okeania sp. SIO2C9]